MVSSVVNVALAGIGGYGDSYLEALLNDPRASRVRLIGVADPAPQRCRRLNDLRARNIPIHPSIQSLFAAPPVPIDLMMIVTPIHLHANHTCFALERGASVLCEKPLAATLAHATQMAQCEARAGGRFVAIGYQWSFSDAIQALKRDILSGELGRPLRLRTIVFFPRGLAYFNRNDWVGRLAMPDGETVLDSPANNATAHYLHNMLYVLGATRETSAFPKTVQAELYRANDIENYDTAAMRVRTTCGAELLFYTTHAVTDRCGPVCRYEFEKGVVEFDQFNGSRFVARFHDGRKRVYGDPNADRNLKIWQSVNAVRTGQPVACGVRAATSHTMCVLAAQLSSANIASFPESLRRVRGENGDSMIYVERLSESLRECFEAAVLPAEFGTLDWARPARAVHLDELVHAPAALAGRVSVQVASPRPITTN